MERFLDIPSIAKAAECDAAYLVNCLLEIYYLYTCMIRHSFVSRLTECMYNL